MTTVVRLGNPPRGRRACGEISRVDTSSRPRHPRPAPSPAYLAVCRPIEREANRARIERATPLTDRFGARQRPNREAASPTSVIATTMTSTWAATLITGSNGSSSEPSSIIGPRFAAYRSDRAIGIPNHSTTHGAQEEQRDIGSRCCRPGAREAPRDNRSRAPSQAADDRGGKQGPVLEVGALQSNEIDAVAAEQRTGETAEAGADRGDERPRAWRHVRQSRAGRTAAEAILRIRHRHATQSLHLRDVKRADNDSSNASACMSLALSPPCTHTEPVGRKR